MIPFIPFAQLRVATSSSTSILGYLLHSTILTRTGSMVRGGLLERGKEYTRQPYKWLTTSHTALCMLSHQRLLWQLANQSLPRPQPAGSAYQRSSGPSTPPTQTPPTQPVGLHCDRAQTLSVSTPCAPQSLPRQQPSVWRKGGGWGGRWHELIH